MDEPGGFGEFATPQGGAQQTGDWGAYLKDPVNRAALLSFGLQAMTGGWGNGMQQAAQAIGAGAAGAEGASGAQRDQALAERERIDKLGESAAGRAQSQTNAQIGADSRADVANIRGEYRLQALADSKKNDQTWMKAYAEARRTYEGNLQNLSKPQGEREMDIMALADRIHAQYAARGSGDPGGFSPPPPAGTVPPTQTPAAQPAAPSGSPMGFGLFPPRAHLQIPGFGGSAQQPQTNPLDAVTKNPDFQRLAATPEGRQQLLQHTQKVNPQLVPALQAYFSQGQQQPGGVP